MVGWALVIETRQESPVYDLRTLVTDCFWAYRDDCVQGPRNARIRHVGAGSWHDF